MSLGVVIRPQARLFIYRWSPLSRPVAWHVLPNLGDPIEWLSEALMFANTDIQWQPSLEAALMRHLGHPVAMSDREAMRFPQAHYEHVTQHTYDGFISVAEWVSPTWARGRILID